MLGGMNPSLSAGMILLSSALPKEHQGIAASFISAMVNYSKSVALGVAGSISANLDREIEHDCRIRVAWWFGIGLSGVGLRILGWFVWKSRSSQLEGGWAGSEGGGY
ncbi:hypothetical protein K469DRAFT_719871 [Zopfia rhizophila CBS 207.26]|uniref:Major facilitator superfamily (MFS) profile domain-containing protein n=1 Tax=Zopfia rhizophila CBS 207.26 TaxID=1314779 RepID=A0A6A6EJ10_9PEZI|nr:hypothetical protein K469DRAFT_719871 [Zopfia rhizophila CBS 207.26]